MYVLTHFITNNLQQTVVSYIYNDYNDALSKLYAEMGYAVSAGIERCIVCIYDKDMNLLKVDRI